MKLNLLLKSPHDVRSGYLNIDPFAEAQNDPAGRVKADVSNLDDVVDGAEATEIVALDILDYFPAPDGDHILNNWLSKLARGGRLTISVVDVREIARCVIYGRLSMEDINTLVHGEQQEAWQSRRASYTLSQLVEVFKNKGYKIISRRVTDFRAVITVERQS